MDRGHGLILMDESMKESGKRVKVMDREPLLILMDKSMKESFKKE